MAAGESKVERYLKLRVIATGGMTRKVKWLDRSGAPDRLVCWTFPNVALVEVKRPGKTVDPQSLQAREIRKLRESGWPVYVVSSREEVDALIVKMTVDKVKGTL